MQTPQAPLRAVAVIAALAALTISAVGADIDRAPFDRATPGSTQTVATGDIKHVANISYTGGSDLEFFRRKGRDYVIAGVLDQAVRIIDITNPERPRQVATIPCTLYQNDVQIFRTTVLMAADSTSECQIGGEKRSFRGFAVADISNPRRPKVLAIAEISRGAHNLTIHPGGRYVYVSNSELDDVGYIHIWDINNPAKPVKVRDKLYHPSLPPHDITFNASGTRAYVAAITHTDILDTTHPGSPKIMHTWVDPAINISHQADPTPDGKYLIVSDEVAGAATGPVCPGGGLHVYDISNEAVPPIKVGVFWADNVELSGTCTSHVFRINPDSSTMAIAWYNAGVHVIDFGDAVKAAVGGTGSVANVGVRTIAALKLPGADTWSAKMWQRRHPGYVFANDMGRGFDVFYVPALAR